LLGNNPWLAYLQMGVQTYMALDAQAQLASQRAAMEGKDPERAYRRAMQLGVGKIVGLALLPRHVFGTSPMGLFATGLFNWAVHGGVSNTLSHWRRMTAEYRASVIPMMHSYEHTERSYQAMQHGMSAIHGYRSVIGSEAAVMASRYGR
jgi:hypothetical protein